MTWNSLKSINQIEEIIKLSEKKPVLIFKHSTRCSISSISLSRMENENHENDIDAYLLDILKNREISNYISNEFEIEHQSPQAILLFKREVIYHNSHLNINYNEMKLKLELI